MMKPELLVSSCRGGYTEKLHYGFIWLIDSQKRLESTIGDDGGLNFPFRSVAKPLQACCVLESGAYKRFGLSMEELAVVCASHSGTLSHREKVLSILRKISLNQEFLQCGELNPLSESEREFLVRKELSCTSLHNNCSGKHAGMLAVCAMKNWDIPNYLDLGHPLQQEIFENIKEFCELESTPESVYDGCSAPVPALPHINMGIGFLKLLQDKRYRDIYRAMQANPYLAGGEYRLDSEIMVASEGALVCKVGAEGLCVVVNPAEGKVLLVKICDANHKARAVATLQCLEDLGWLSKNFKKNQKNAKNLKNLKNLADKSIKNTKNDIVGEVKVEFVLR